MTFDGTALNCTTGEPDPLNLHYWTAASKESMHLAISALYLYNKIHRTTPFNLTLNEEQVIRTLEKKISSYEKFNENYPGYGGHLPWMFVRNGTITPANGWYNSTPSLDNGEMIFGLKALYEVLRVRGYFKLSKRY
jgi:hypothetical protein